MILDMGEVIKIVKLFEVLFRLAHLNERST